MDPNPYIALADRMVMVNQGLLYDPLAYINQMANEHDPLKSAKAAFTRSPTSGQKALACGKETGLAFFAAFPGMNRKWLAAHAKASISGTRTGSEAKAKFYRGVLNGYYGPTGETVDNLSIALVEVANITADTAVPGLGKGTSPFSGVLDALNASGIQSGLVGVQDSAHALVNAVPDISLAKTTQALKENLSRSPGGVTTARGEVQDALIDLYPGDPVAEVIKTVRSPENFPFKAGSIIEVGGHSLLEMPAGGGGAEQASDDALKYVGNLAPEVSVEDVQRMGGAFTESLRDELAVDTITQKGSNTLATMQTDMTEKAGRWSEAMMAEAAQTSGATVANLARTALGNVGLPPVLQEAIAGPLASAAQSASTAGIQGIATALGATGALAGPVGLVVGPLVGWGLTKLFGDTPEKPPTPPDVPVKRYGHKRVGAGGAFRNEDVENITPLLVLQNLFRANMRWHRAYHPYPSVDFTDFRSTPGPLDFGSVVWQGGEQIRSSYYQPGLVSVSGRVHSKDLSPTHEVPLYGPWTPSGYGSNYRLVLSGRISQSDATARFGGNVGLRYPPEAGPPTLVVEEGPGGQKIKSYRFIHDAISEITGASVGATSLASRQIRAAFAWGEDRPHLAPFTPYLDEIGWAEFICATALIDHWAYYGDKIDPLRYMPGNPGKTLAIPDGVQPKMSDDNFSPQDIARIGSDPTSSGLAALCFVTQTLRLARAGIDSFLGDARGGYGSAYALQAGTNMAGEINAYTQDYKAQTGQQRPGQAAVNAEDNARLEAQRKKNEEEQRKKEQDQKDAAIKKAGIPTPLVVAGLGVAGYQWWKGRQS